LQKKSSLLPAAAAAAAVRTFSFPSRLMLKEELYKMHVDNLHAHNRAAWKKKREYHQFGPIGLNAVRNVFSGQNFLHEPNKVLHSFNNSLVFGFFSSSFSFSHFLSHFMQHQCVEGNNSMKRTSIFPALWLRTFEKKKKKNTIALHIPPWCGFMAATAENARFPCSQT
jgi:hypothetical protein